MPAGIEEPVGERCDAPAGLVHDRHADLLRFAEGEPDRGRRVERVREVLEERRSLRDGLVGDRNRDQHIGVHDAGWCSITFDGHETEERVRIACARLGVRRDRDREPDIDMEGTRAPRLEDGLDMRVDQLACFPDAERVERNRNRCRIAILT